MRRLQRSIPDVVDRGPREYKYNHVQRILPLYEMNVWRPHVEELVSALASAVHASVENLSTIHAGKLFHS